jgi:hypothetical protein
MSDGITCEITGLDALLRELRALPEAVQTKVLPKAVGAGAAVIRKEVALRAPEATGPISEGHPPAGTLKKAIYSIRLKDQCSPTFEVWKVGVRKGRGARETKRRGGVINLDAFYASWVEYGHFARVPHAMTKAARAAARAVGTAKWVPAHPFFRPAVAVAQNRAFAAMKESLMRELPLAMVAMQYLRATKS